MKHSSHLENHRSPIHILIPDRHITATHFAVHIISVLAGSIVYCYHHIILAAES